MDKNILSKNLGIEYVKEVDKNAPAKTNLPVKFEKKEDSEKQVALTDDAQADYELARQTLMALLQQGVQAVEDARNVASSNENPMSFQAVASLIKAVGDTTKDLFDIHKKTKQLKEISQEPGKKIMDDGNVNIDKAVFVGTTSELMEKIKAKNK